MLDILLWLSATLVVIATAYALTMFFWHPDRNIDRSRFGHWYRSLIRLYEPDAQIDVVQRHGPLTFTLLRRGGDVKRCWAVLRLPHSTCTGEQLDAIRFAIASEPSVLILSEGPPALEIQISIADIWSSKAADVIVWVTEHVLGILRVPTDARFDFEFSGERSQERALEARRRQRDGSLGQW